MIYRDRADRLVQTVLAANRSYLLGWNDGPATGDVYRSGLPHAPLNGVVRLAGRAPAEAYAQAGVLLDGVPRVWWVGADSDPGTAEALEALGARLVNRLPVMVAEVAAASVVPEPSGVSIEEARDIGEFVTAYAQVSGIPPEAAPRAAEREKTFGHAVLRLAARLDDGRIAGTAEAWFTDGLVTLYFVGTRPDHRRRGIGAALTQAVLRRAAVRGIPMAALTSTPIAVPVYERLGFHEISRYQLYAF
ncbi:GNAT family N-acetyltransferase [Paractinoplanes hotanensis]|uniref:GNAT family N-acetyltransferase n=1 Tax=Paractinoplanes hotanensis TaxID=2906497 RepID=A0ABT0XUM2_9ACTN|nr:GNAT family N-acetyltransferase [Actinoplanes hotanensis]MCM4077500.1 GNAT family N-acetyltransferase [Actinoplanes hotanensis]